MLVPGEHVGDDVVVTGSECSTQFGSGHRSRRVDRHRCGHNRASSCRRSPTLPRARGVDRYYDPATDQFMSVDPDVMETGQPYAFTGDDPLNGSDPLGLCNPVNNHVYKGPCTKRDKAAIRAAARRAEASARHSGSEGLFGLLWHTVLAAPSNAVHHPVQIAATAAVFIATAPGDDIGAGEAADAEMLSMDVESEADATADEADVCPAESFTPATLVNMANGTMIPISSVKVGDKVLAINPVTKKVTPEVVTATNIHVDDDLMNVVIRTALGTYTLHTTDKHPFWDAATSSWTLAQNLKTGDHLVTDDGASAVVVTTIQLAGKRAMWDLTVAHDHDFYLSGGAGSQTAVLVHNCPTSSQGQPFDENQRAVVKLAQSAVRSGLSDDDFSTLSDWADEYGLSSRGPEIHPDGDGWASENWHGHIGPINHIPITMQP